MASATCLSISGSVVWEDGSPADGAEIKIFDMAFPGHYAGCHFTEARRSAEPSTSPVVSTGYQMKGPACGLESKADGSFTLKMYSSRSYRVTAQLERTISGKKIEYLAESEPFPLTGGIKIKLVLKQQEQRPQNKD